MDAYNDALESRTNAIMDSFKLFDSYTQKDAVTAQTLIENLQSQEEAMQLYTDNLNALYARQLPDDFLESIRDEGVDATQEIIALNSMTDEQLANYVEMWQNLNKQAQEQATIDLSGLKEETVTQIEELTNTANDELATLKKTYEKNLKELGTTAKKTAASSGSKTTKALANAVKKGTKEVTNNVAALKNSVLSQLNALASSAASIASEISSTLAGISADASSITIPTIKTSGSHANGLDYVPYNGYIAQLHKGEAVLTVEENANRNNNSSGNSFYFYGTPPLDEKETARQMKLAQQQLAMGF
jgi:NADH dehydrogenase/NADH:ubiquinone oxidoreductase subunit G